MSSFIDVADALTAIKDGKLYREEYKTFAEYCSRRWKFAKSYANYLIQSAKTVRDLPEELATMVANSERTARAITSVEPIRREEVVRAAVENVNRATEVRVLAERQMGTFLKDMPKTTGELKRGPAVVHHDHGEIKTLAEIGITKDQSSRAQKLAERSRD